MRTVKHEEFMKERRERLWQMRLAGWRKPRLYDRRPRDPVERAWIMETYVERVRRARERGAYEFLGPRHVRIHLDRL